MIYLVYGLILCTALVAAFSIILISYKAGISPMPSTKRMVKAILYEIDETLDTPLYDLGSGWGHLIFPLARAFPHRPVIGIEESLFPFLFTKMRHLFSREPNLKIFYGDFFEHRLVDGAEVTCYLCTRAMKKMPSYLPQKWRLLSNTFSIPSLTPKKTISIPGLFSFELYLYESE